MHINAAIDRRPGFTEIALGKFRAVVRNERVEKIRDYLGLSPRQLVSRATKFRGVRSGYRDHRAHLTDHNAAIKAGIKSWALSAPYQWQHHDVDGDAPKQCQRPAAELAREVASCPYSQLCFWSYCWAYASAREGLHVFSDDVVVEA